MAAATIDGIICIGGDAWGDVKRPTQLMLRLSERVPVVYVEPYLSVTSVLKNWRVALKRPFRARLRRALTGRTCEAVPGLHIVTPLVAAPPNRLSALLPLPALRAVSRAQHRGAATRARRTARRLGITSPLVWVSYPALLPASSGGQAGLTVYDCMDRWTDFPDVLADHRYRSLVEEAEQQVLSVSDLVFCSATGLFDAKRATVTSPVMLVRNGADAEHFAPKGRPVPSELAHLPHPMVGYIGALADWFDFDLLRAVALARPDWSVVLIGPLFDSKSSGDARALDLVSGLPNVHVLGMRSYADLPPYLEAFDVAVIPFKINGLTADTDPIKVYEYLAAGVPVVSTPLPEVERLAEVRRASIAPEFVRQCEAAIAERFDPDLVALRIEAGRRNSWEARAEVAWQAITDVSQGRAACSAEVSARRVPESRAVSMAPNGRSQSGS